MLSPTALLKKTTLHRLDREARHREHGSYQAMTLRRPTLKHLARTDISSLDLYIAKHNAKMALIAPASWKKHVYSLRHEWHSQYETSIDAATAQVEGPVYRLKRPPIADIQGFKFFDAQRLDEVSIATFETFQHRFHRFTGGILQGLDFYKIVVCGGCVQACLIPAPGGGFHPSFADSDVENIIDFDNAFKVVRSPASVTFAPIPGLAALKYRKVQVILVLYRNVADVISHFDLDHTSLAYDGETVWIAPRAARALWLGYSILTDAIRSSTAPRLLKYADRGFGLLLQVGQDIQGESMLALQDKVANERQHVILIYQEAIRSQARVRMGPLVSLSKVGIGHQWTHALASLVRLAALWEITYGCPKRVKALMKATKGSGGMYGFYNESNPENWETDAATYMESFMAMNFVVEDTLEAQFLGPMEAAFVPFKVGGSVAAVTSQALGFSVVLPIGFREAFQATRYISLKQEPLTNVVEDEHGHQFELCEWSISPSNMWSAAPNHAMAPHIRFLKKATMLTAWVVRRIDNGAPWDEIRHGKTLQQMVDNDIDAALGTAANFKKWIAA